MGRLLPAGRFRQGKAFLLLHHSWPRHRRRRRTVGRCSVGAPVLIRPVDARGITSAARLRWFTRPVVARWFVFTRGDPHRGSTHGIRGHVPLLRPGRDDRTDQRRVVLLQRGEHDDHLVRGSAPVAVGAGRLPDRVPESGTRPQLAGGADDAGPIDRGLVLLDATTFRDVHLRVLRELHQSSAHADRLHRTVGPEQSTLEHERFARAATARCTCPLTRGSEPRHVVGGAEPAWAGLAVRRVLSGPAIDQPGRQSSARDLLPPGYNPHRRTPYPTLYLSHGGGGNEVDGRPRESPTESSTT